ncbi:MAG TPA: phosphotransferase family protein [Acidimicrobiales bacterium]|jgi:aminoglycoside phosphotransferase (APT) family kinase protein
MSDGQEIPWRRDPAEVGGLLAKWARHAVGPDALVSQVKAPDGNGMSSETLLFVLRRRSDATPERYAARLAPLPSLVPVFADYDLETQSRCMELVAGHTDVPVPRVCWLEQDPRWLQAPFLVMNHVDGVVPTDMPPYVFGGWLADASREDQARLQASAVGLLTRLHELAPKTADLTFLDHPEHGATPLDRYLNTQRWYYDWARDGVSYTLIDDAFAWLEAHRPAEGPTVLNWGDARIGNILFQDFEPVAVLDWEMAAVGPAEVDLAWMIFLHHFFQDIAVRSGRPGLPGFMRREEMAATYERLSGRAVHDLEWFEVFAALRFAIVSVRLSTRSIGHGMMESTKDPNDLIMFRALLEQMLEGTYWG